MSLAKPVPYPDVALLVALWALEMAVFLTLLGNYRLGGRSLSQHVLSVPGIVVILGLVIGAVSAGLIVAR